jgi:hypothetical protein
MSAVLFFIALFLYLFFGYVLSMYLFNNSKKEFVLLSPTFGLLFIALLVLWFRLFEIELNFIHILVLISFLIFFAYVYSYYRNRRLFRLFVSGYRSIFCRTSLILLAMMFVSISLLLYQLYNVGYLTVVGSSADASSHTIYVDFARNNLLISATEWSTHWKDVSPMVNYYSFLHDTRVPYPKGLDAIIGKLLQPLESSTITTISFIIAFLVSLSILNTYIAAKLFGFTENESLLAASLILISAPLYWWYFMSEWPFMMVFSFLLLVYALIYRCFQSPSLKSCFASALVLSGVLTFHVLATLLIWVFVPIILYIFILKMRHGILNTLIKILLFSAILSVPSILFFIPRIDYYMWHLEAEQAARNTITFMLWGNPFGLIAPPLLADYNLVVLSGEIGLILSVIFLLYIFHSIILKSSASWRKNEFVVILLVSNLLILSIYYALNRPSPYNRFRLYTYGIIAIVISSEIFASLSSLSKMKLANQKILRSILISFFRLFLFIVIVSDMTFTMFLTYTTMVPKPILTENIISLNQNISSQLDVINNTILIVYSGNNPQYPNNNLYWLAYWLKNATFSNQESNDVRLTSEYNVVLIDKTSPNELIFSKQLSVNGFVEKDPINSFIVFQRESNFQNKSESRYMNVIFTEAENWQRHGDGWLEGKPGLGGSSGTRVIDNISKDYIETIVDIPENGTYAVYLHHETGPEGGIYSFYTDGTLMGAFDQYNLTYRYIYDNVNAPLSQGQHTFKVTVNGTKNIKSSNYWVDMDYVALLKIDKEH